MHSHDSSNAVFAGKHKFENGSYVEVKDENFKGSAYPKHVYSTDKKGELVSVVVADPRAERNLKGEWYASPNEALEAFEEGPMPKAAKPKPADPASTPAV